MRFRVFRAVVVVAQALLLLGWNASAKPSAYRDDRIILKPRETGMVNQTRVHAAHARVGAHIRREYPKLRGIQVVGLPRGLSVKDAIDYYQRTGLFEYVEPDYEVHIVDMPNDPLFQDGSLWGLHNTGQNGGTPDADIDAPEAWDVRSNAETVIVAVIDTGIDYTHPDLVSNLWVNPCINCPVNGIVYTNDVHGINAITGTGDPLDDHFHGTHCAGTIGGVDNNGIGVVGVARRVKIMACKFLDSTGSGSTSDAIECVNYAINKGAHIMSNSWGCQGCFDQSLLDAINAARAQGMIFVAAAGNSAANIDTTPFYPADYSPDNVVAVAATDRNDQLASFSNYGIEGVDLAAPGVAIWSTFPTYQTASIIANGWPTNYYSISGTSMATPHVAGALALVKAQFPSETYSQLIVRVLGNTDQLPSLSGKCATEGRLNLYKALAQTPAPISRFSAAPSSGEPPLTVSFTDQSLGAVTNRAWNFGDGSPINNSTNPTHLYANLGSYTVTLTVYGVGGSRSSTKTITVAYNYQMLPTTFSWVDPSAMTLLTLGDDDVSAAQSLPFPFVFYGSTNSVVYVGSNGLIGFDNSTLYQYLNADMPDTTAPNNIICPYWDDLNPGTNGQVRIGTIGSAPNRKVVISWVGVPHWPNFTPTYTFQVLLHETSNNITFQYLDVQPTDTTYGQGRDATVGIENAAGTIARKFSYNGAALLTNSQAILFTTNLDFKILSIVAGVTNFTVTWNVVPLRSYQPQYCTNLASGSWLDLGSPITAAVNQISMSTTDVTTASQRFYRIKLMP